MRPLHNLNLLRTFDMSGRYLSFKKASEYLSITPSAVSQQISLLEEQLGVQLFIRGNRKLQLTIEGKNYWSRISFHLNKIDELTSTIQLNKNKKVLKVSILPPVANRVVLPNLSTFNAQYPNIDLQIEATLSNTEFQKNNIDLAIRFGTPPWDGANHEKLINIESQLLCPPGFIEKYKLNNKSHKLDEMPLIGMTNRPFEWDKWFENANLDKSTNQKFYYVDDYPTAIEASEVLGATLGMYPIESHLIASGRVEAPNLPRLPLASGIFAVYPQNTKNNGEIEAFITWLKSIFDKLT